LPSGTASRQCDDECSWPLGRLGGAGLHREIWDAITLKLMHTFRGQLGPIRCLAISRDGKFLVSGSSDKTVKVWELTRLDKKLKD
jgi:WD40 repeat protein